MDELNGRVAVITGGGSGIGFAMARAFAREGMKVMLADIDAERLGTATATLEREGATVAGRLTDVTKPEQIVALADDAYARFGAVHVLCNNAGIGSSGLTWELDEVEWRWVMDVCFWAVVRGVHAFVPRMLAGGEPGHVVNTSSMAGLITGVAGMGPYNAAKHAVVGMTETLFRELKLTGASVSASVLCPGYVTTGIRESSVRSRPADYGSATASAATSLQTMNTAAEPRDSFDPSYVADEVVSAIKEDRFYILPAQPAFFEWLRVGHERMLSGKNPSLPRRARENQAGSPS